MLLRSLILCFLLCLIGIGKVISNKFFINDQNFHFGDEAVDVVIYRLIGNDMPPLQSVGQLRWNTYYTLQNEPVLNGAKKRWILNRIWNSTEFEMLYFDLVRSGVHRRDILAKCFDYDKYNSIDDIDDRMYYLTGQNEGRNSGIQDGRDSGFEWSVILDGNTYITLDSWEALQRALSNASKNKLKYLKIPYHRVHETQQTTWLNGTTNIRTVLQYAPDKGESQVAFHSSAKEIFTLGDTKPDGKSKAQRKGYGKRNKSYLFKEGAVCGRSSEVCACSYVIEGNEEDITNNSMENKIKYSEDCGLVLRLWNYPTPDLIQTGLEKDEEKGFFCYLRFIHDDIKHDNECDLIRSTVPRWLAMKDSEKKSFLSNSENCKKEYSPIFLKESCFRAAAREAALELTSQNVETYIAHKKSAKDSNQKPLCERLRPKPNDPSRQHYLTVFDEKTLVTEKIAFQSKGSSEQKEISPIINNLLNKADRSMKFKPNSVLDKKKLPRDTSDKRYYYSARPYFWPLEQCPSDIQQKAKKGEIRVDDKGYVHREGVRVAGTVIGGPQESDFDRAAAWYMIDNVTTLALAWFYTDTEQYASRAVQLVDKWFLDEKTGMYPSLLYAQDGDRSGLIDWKDLYYLLDAFTLLERSKQLSKSQVLKLQRWCAQLSHWMMNSNQGHQEGSSLNNHGLYFDMSVIALANYAQDDDLIDVIRSHLYYRLSKPYPLGHFALDGSQPYETFKSVALHYVSFNLAGWIHVAQIVEAIRQHAELPGAMESLWWIRHENEPKDAQPVLVKAIRWLARFLPQDSKFYEMWTKPIKGMGVNFPYEHQDLFAFDRLLEVIRCGVNIYGVNRIFPDKNLPAVKIFLEYPKYSISYGTMTEYSSVNPDSGNRAWPALGMYSRDAEAQK